MRSYRPLEVRRLNAGIRPKVGTAAFAQRSAPCAHAAPPGERPERGTMFVIRTVPASGRPAPGWPRNMARAGRVLVPGRAEHDERRGHDLDPAQRDEDPGVDGHGARCG